MLGSGGHPGWTVCGRDPLDSKDPERCLATPLACPPSEARERRGEANIQKFVGKRSFVVPMHTQGGDGCTYNSLLP